MGTYRLTPTFADTLTGWAVQESVTNTPYGGPVVDAVNGSGLANLVVSRAALAVIGTTPAAARFSFVGDCCSLDGGPLISFASLPSGFTPTSVYLESYSAADPAPSVFGPGSAVFVSTESGEEFPDTAGGSPSNYACAVASAINVFGHGVGVRGNLQSDEPGGGTLSCGGLAIWGDYILIASTWWYSPSLETYAEQPDGDPPPGGDYVRATPVIVGIAPNHGPTAGGTAITITGDGFHDVITNVPNVERVLFDGEFPGTDVVVVDAQHLTCVAPAHWRGSVDVTITTSFTAP